MVDPVRSDFVLRIGVRTATYGQSPVDSIPPLQHGFIVRYSAGSGIFPSATTEQQLLEVNSVENCGAF